MSAWEHAAVIACQSIVCAERVASANQPSARSARPPLQMKPRIASAAAMHRKADHAAEREPGGDSGSEADYEPRRQLCPLALEKALDAVADYAVTRLPIAPSPLWKRRTRYVRGARPLHIWNKRRGKRA